MRRTRTKRRRRRRRVPPFVAAGRARAHVRELLDAGTTVNEVARRAGLSATTITKLLLARYGTDRRTRRVPPETESRILAVLADVVTPPTEPRNADRHRQEVWFVDLEPLPAGIDMTWRANGACSDPQIPTCVFFLGRGDIETVRAAQQICAGCEVAEPCLQFALAVCKTSGIWGGTTELERQKMLGQRGGLDAFSEAS